MTTNLRLKNPTCRAYTFKRLLSYVFNQIKNFIMVLIETVGQKRNKNPRLRDLAAKNSRIRDAKKHKKTRFRDSFKTPPRFRDWNKNFGDPEFSGYHSSPLRERHMEQRRTKTLPRDTQLSEFDGLSSSKCWRKPTTCTLE